MNEKNEVAIGKGKFENAAEEVSKVRESTTAAVKNVGGFIKKEAQEVYSQSKEHLGKAAQNIREGALESCTELRDQAQQKGEKCLKNATTTFQNMQSRCENYIRTHPFKSILVAVGTACLLKAIFKPKS